MNLATTYLGLKLPHPLMPGSSPLVDDMDMVKRLEDAGAAAIVMHSLFEEQIQGEQLASIYHMEMYADAYQEALSYFPRASEFRLGPEQYLDQIRRIKQAVDVPVIASLNGTSRTGWLEYASLIQQAGADALELNVYHIVTDPHENGQLVEKRVLEITSAIKEAVSIPVAVKLSPQFSSLPNLTFELEDAAPTDSFCSTVSTSPTLTWRRWKSSPVCDSASRPSCCSVCAGWQFSPVRAVHPSHVAVASTVPRMPSKRFSPVPAPYSSFPPCFSTAPSILRLFAWRWRGG